MVQWRDYVEGAMAGTVRGVVVDCLNHPLDGIKMRYQCAPSTGSLSAIIQEVIRNGELYRGFAPQLCKTALKQFWRFPLIQTIPEQLTQWSRPVQQITTGLTIALVDATVLNPWERYKAGAILSSEKRWHWMQGWQGWRWYSFKLSMTWISFLVTQDYLREKARGSSQEPLSMARLTLIGLQGACLVSIVANSCDLFHTRKQALLLKDARLHLAPLTLWQWARCWPLTLTTLAIHNITSVILLEALDKRRCATRNLS